MGQFEMNSGEAHASALFRDNETISIILGRRSIRVFEERPVEREKIDTLLECAFAAPSAMNIRPCHFMVIDDRELLTRIGASTERARMVSGAPLAIAACVDVANYEKEHKLTDGTWMKDSSCAMENLLLAARALGLEGVWLQIANRPERESAISPILNVPSGVKLFAMAVLGYGAEVKAPHSGADKTKIHRNSW